MLPIPPMAMEPSVVLSANRESRSSLARGLISVLHVGRHLLRGVRTNTPRLVIRSL